MITEIKKRLLNEPNKLVELLEYFGFCHIHLGKKYLTCGRDEESSSKGITIYLEDNDYLYVKDWSNNVCEDIYSYIIRHNNCTFKEIFNICKSILHITDNVYSPRTKRAFGGFYDAIKCHNGVETKTIDSSKVSCYPVAPNLRFARDGISFLTQREFELGYDASNQAITIPLWNEVGEYVGVKARVNEDDPEGSKYFYIEPTNMSNLLYGYWQNYAYLVEAEEVVVFEAEKSVMQCHSFGVRNCVALGSSSLSKKQIQLILSLNPSRIILAHDKGLKYEAIKNNITMLKAYGRMKSFEVEVVDMEDEAIPDKSSPSDLGEEKYHELIKFNVISSKEFLERGNDSE